MHKLENMFSKTAITKVQGIIVIIIAVIAIAGGYYGLRPPAPVTTTTPTTMTTQTPTPVVGGTLVVEGPRVAKTLDPAFAWLMEDGEAVFNVYQSLIAFKDGVGKPELVPLLAESYTISPDALVYTFKIRKGVTFSNGDPLNAYCFLYSLYRTSISGYSPSWMVTYFLGKNFWVDDGVTAEKLNMWNTPDNTPPTDQVELVKDPKHHISAPDPYTLVIRLDKTMSAFLPTLTQPHSVAMSPRWVTENGGIEAGKHNEYIMLHAMGTGPWMITRFEVDVQTVFEKNPNYWGGPRTGVHDPAKLDKVIFKLVPDELTRLGDLQRGVAQIVAVSPELLDQALKPGYYVPDLGPMPMVQYISMNYDRFPFNNKLVRQAVVRAIDYDAILKIARGQAVKWQMGIPNGVLGQDPTIKPYERDLEKAKALLVEAGYPDGKGIPELTLLFGADSPLMPRISELIQRNLAEIGLKVKLEGETSSAQEATYAGVVNGTDPRYPDLIYEDWGWYPDAFAFLDWFVSDIGFQSTGNPGFYSNPQIEELLDKANSAATQDERFGIYSQIEKILYEEAPCIPVFQWKNAYIRGLAVAADNVQGIIPNCGDWQYNWSPIYFVK
jgi:peptide/nickel transport system substrate-binding protein